MILLPNHIMVWFTINWCQFYNKLFYNKLISDIKVNDCTTKKFYNKLISDITVNDCTTKKILKSRHGPEVPKFDFMAVGFETYCHSGMMAQLITFSVESPPTYILLNLKNSNLCPSQQNPNWAQHLKMPPHWFEQWQGFWQPCQTYCCCIIWNTTDRTISIRLI